MTSRRRPVVALVTDAIYPYFRGGKELRYHEVAQRLGQRADVHVFTMKWWDGPRRAAGADRSPSARSPAASHVLGRAPVVTARRSCSRSPACGCSGSAST